MSEEGLRFEPGKGCAYSNAGYYILGLIIEKATGKSYEKVLGGQILGPLGMADAGGRSAFLEIGERLGPGVAARDKIKISDVSLGQARIRGNSVYRFALGSSDKGRRQISPLGVPAKR